MRENIECGDLVKDKITPYEGIVVATEEWSSGVAKAQVQPRELNPQTLKPIEGMLFDFEMLTIKNKGAVAAIPVHYDGPITFGSIVRDKHAGYKGIVTQFRKSISGCLQVGVYPNTYNDLLGDIKKGYLFLISEVELVRNEQQRPRDLVTSGTGPQPVAESAW